MVISFWQPLPPSAEEIQEAKRKFEAGQWEDITDREIWIARHFKESEEEVEL